MRLLKKTKSLIKLKTLEKAKIYRELKAQMRKKQLKEKEIIQTNHEDQTDHTPKERIRNLSNQFSKRLKKNSEMVRIIWKNPAKGKINMSIYFSMKF